MLPFFGYTSHSRGAAADDSDVVSSLGLCVADALFPR